MVDCMDSNLDEFVTIDFHSRAVRDRTELDLTHLKNEDNIELEYQEEEDKILSHDSDYHHQSSLSSSSESDVVNSEPVKQQASNTTPLQKISKKSRKWFRKNLRPIRLLKMSILVFLISNIGHSTFFAYTSVEALSNTFYNIFQIGSNQFSNLFTVYAAPNTVMVFMSGVVIDIVGPSVVSLILSILVAVATLMGALSPPNYSLMLGSRFLLGFAGESLVACSNTIMSKTFSTAQLPLVMGILMGWIYSANLLSLLLLPAVNKAAGFDMTLWVIFINACIGLVTSILYLLFKNWLMDKPKGQEEIKMEVVSQDGVDAATPSQEQEQLENSTVITTTNREERSSSVESLENEEAQIIYNEAKDDDISDASIRRGVRSKFRLLYFKMRAVLFKVIHIFIQIPVRMWIIVGIVFFGYIGLFGLAIIGPAFLGEKYGYNEQKAALILSAETICSAVISPICGIFISRFSKKIPVMFVSMILLALGLLFLVITDVAPLVWIIVCGVGYAVLNTTIVSTLPVFVPDTVIATCYGFIGTSYNLSLVVFPSVLGSLRESSGDYINSFYVLFASCMFAAFLILLLKYFDRRAPIDKRLDSDGIFIKEINPKKKNSFAHH